MLENTFVHLPGVGYTMERSLWDQGCLSWSHLLSGMDRFRWGSVEREDMRRRLERSVDALAKRKHQHFRKGLGAKEAWRAYPEFRSSCVYLDIETDGGQKDGCITTIGMFDGETYTCLVKDIDLGNFPDLVSHYSMIVSFAGIGFDLPMLQRNFWGLKFDQIHIDLCPTFRRLGIHGGLKSIEKQLDIRRSAETDGLTGRDAIRLWRQYRNREDEDALKLLIDYNREDVVNLEKLMLIAYGLLEEKTFGHVQRQLNGTIPRPAASRGSASQRSASSSDRSSLQTALPLES